MVLSIVSPESFGIILTNMLNKRNANLLLPPCDKRNSGKKMQSNAKLSPLFVLYNETRHIGIVNAYKKHKSV